MSDRNKFFSVLKKTTAEARLAAAMKRLQHSPKTLYLASLDRSTSFSICDKVSMDGFVSLRWIIPTVLSPRNTETTASHL